MFHAFLSYARNDDEPFVRRLYDDLTRRAFRIWWDREKMPNRGIPFLQEIRDYIDESERLIAIVGPQALRSDYVRAEWEHARIFSKGLIAIPRLCNYDEIPPELAKFHGPDFHDDSRYIAALDELDRILHEEVKAVGPLAGAVPALPSYFLPRAEDLEHIHNFVLADIDRPVSVAHANRITSLWGMPGSGKSVLAAAFARAVETRRSFSHDGVIWVAVGQNPSPAHIPHMLGAALGVELRPEPHLAVAGLSKALQGRRCLIVLDDVWEAEDVEHVVNALDERCRLLITTRDAEVASAFSMNNFPVRKLADDASLRLLAAYAQIEPRSLLSGGSLHTDASRIAELCENLPFALALCGAMIAQHNRWPDLILALEKADLTYIESKLPNYHYKNILVAQEVSVKRLEPPLDERYRDLVVFAADRGIPEEAVLTLWSEAGFADYESRKALASLRSKSLIQLDGDAASRIVSMHDLQRDYLRATVKNAALRHSALISAYAKRAGGEWAKGPNDGYFFERLPTQLVQARRERECEQLLTNFDWLESKLDAVGIRAVLEDYSLLPDRSVAARDVEETIRRSAFTLNEHRGEFAGQLLGRLNSNSLTEVQQMLEAARRWWGRPWLRPLTATLLPPGAAICFTLDGHKGTPRSVAISPDGHWAASAGNSSNDETIRIWDAERGIPIHILPKAAESGEYTNPLGITAEGQWVLCGFGSDVRAWDRATGKLAFTLTGHKSRVTALAVASNLPRAISASKDGALFVWDLEGRSGSQLVISEDIVAAVAISADGRCVSASSASSLRHWDLHANRSWIVAVDTEVYSTPFSNSPDGTYVFFGARRWEPLSGRIENVFPSGGPDRLLALSGQGQVALALADKDSIDIWDVKQGVRVATLPEFAYPRCIALTPDGARAVVGLFNHRVRIWDVKLANADLASAQNRLASCFVTEDGVYGVASFDGGQTQVWDLASGSLAESVPSSTAADLVAQAERRNFASVAAIASAGGFYSSVPEFGAVQPFIRDGADLEDVPVTAVCMSGDGKLVVSGSDEPTELRVRELASGRDVKILQGHRRRVNAVAASAKTNRVVSASEDRTVKIWDLSASSVGPLATFTGEDPMVACAITPDGRTVMAGEDCGRVHILRLEGC